MPWQAIETSKLADLDTRGLEYALCGSIRAVAAALQQGEGRRGSHFRGRSRITRTQTTSPSFAQGAPVAARKCSFNTRSHAPEEIVPVSVSDNLADVAGPMAGLTFPLRLRREDYVLAVTQAGTNRSLRLSSRRVMFPCSFGSNIMALPFSSAQARTWLTLTSR